MIAITGIDISKTEHGGMACAFNMDMDLKNGVGHSTSGTGCGQAHRVDPWGSWIPEILGGFIVIEGYGRI
jgi:hypothetical protein